MLDYLLLLCVGAIFGSTFIVIKDSLNTFDPFLLITIRFSIASILLFIWIKYKNLNIFNSLKYGLITGIIQFLTYAPQTIGLKATSPSNSAFITGMFVVFTPLCSLLLYKKKFRFVDYIAIVLATLGLWIITGGVSNLNYGDLITLITAFTIGLLIVVTSRALEKGADPVIITFHQLIVTAILAGICSVIFKENLQLKSWNLYIPILYLAVFASFIAYIIQNTKLRTVNPIVAAIILSTEPLFALIFSWIFNYEDFQLLKLIGGLLMLIAIVFPDIYSVFRKDNHSDQINLIS